MKHTIVRDLEAYIGGLVIPQGRFSGQPFRLLPWQRRFLRGAFGQPDDAALTLGRGGGKTTLIAALGVRVVVLKSRELWRKDNVIFNLDTVEDVGQIFEVEVQAVEGYDADSQLREYDRLFGPYLGRRIVGSNEDLVP